MSALLRKVLLKIADFINTFNNPHGIILKKTDETMGLNIHVFHNQGQEEIITFKDLDDVTQNYFNNNHIKVSIEKLNGEIIAYGCPFSDKDEESEVIVLGQNKPLKLILEELALECRLTFGEN